MVVPATGAAPGPVQVLIVEDEVLIRTALAEELRDAGFSVIEAASAEEALAFLTAGGRVDVIFSDVRLPGGQDGLALAREVARLAPQLGIILTSGHLDPLAVEGRCRFLPKPYRYETVVALIREALRAREL